MVPSGAFGLPRSEDSGSVRAERWVDANRSKSDRHRPAPAEQTLSYVEAAEGTTLRGLRIDGSGVAEAEVTAGAAGFELSPLGASLCVLLARADGVPLLAGDWAALCEYVRYVDEELGGSEEEAWWPSTFHAFLRCLLARPHLDEHLHPAGGAPLAFVDAVPALELRFPRGAEVRPRRLRGRADLNGRSGAVAKYDAQGGRVGVDFPPPVGLVSIRAANLEIGRHERARRRLEAEERRRRQEYGTRRQDCLFVTERWELLRPEEANQPAQVLLALARAKKLLVVDAMAERAEHAWARLPAGKYAMIDPKGTPWWKVLLAGAAVVGTSVATGAVMMVAIAGKPAFLEADPPEEKAASQAELTVAVATEIPSTQSVSIEGVEVYSQSAGFALLNECRSLPPSLVKDETKPSVKVCGSQTKLTVYLRNRCEDYSSYQHEVGTCNTAADSTFCQEASPATHSWMQTAQSYRITQCATALASRAAALVIPRFALRLVSVTA
ncbi:hypothetical protein EMIHUDRAFT_237031 [Emiliania huxleyi CCMP1516]|uniref:SUEL-type lectin domain-containing protein n=2 Tax=Emiliania huxleyi TaxID=2903 RepID=A0A0D3JRJ5_EMIH1|nr:hypothetical protein EMIHUDRAFT_237031 [Emiliania huxleyi CCMP1516]EOD26130.1 hypothetical protein EMIHUDRAFT_237031 [Emiliania huxleyi CCMP1516]|eukprot:XP_005778559.1 hypothetical protein EMIHUDRAFT_237031 [Emiliania huxleyi CCMP1516]